MSKRSDMISATLKEQHPDVDLGAGRRAFLQSLGLGAVGAAAFSSQALAQLRESGPGGGSVVAPPPATTPPPATSSGGILREGPGGAVAPGSGPATLSLDLQILTFALNLEYLEAEFYLRAVTGNGLSNADIGANPGAVIGGRQVPFVNLNVKAYAQEIANDEKNHVEFLRAALTAAGVVPVSRPAIDLQTSFTTAARAAGLITTGTFDPFADDLSFLLGAYIFEDVGVTAYHGAAPSITNKTYLDKAAGILAVEAYHAGIIRAVLFAQGASDQTQKISNLRATLDGTAGTPQVDDYGVGTLAAPTLVVVDGNSIAFDRTTRQVLNIVYGAQNASSGLFFPSGLNGPIH